MGQSQSTSSHNNSDLDGQQIEGKRDYYELIGVEREASGEEIKKAYRKKALELHPDRNYGNAEAATDLFAEIQSAYEVLSDPQERAWYDSHRELFLGSGGTSNGDHYSYNTRMTTSDDIFKLFPKFTPRMEFSDSPAGFYGALREIFAQLSLEEMLACRWENLEFFDYPGFGTSDSDFEQIRPFYAAWGNFSTKKSFASRDAYRYSEAPDRRVRRMMEKENKRLRDEGIREFNDAVRSLVAFVKKRDPRYKMNSQSEAQRQETLRQSAAAQAAKSRAINQAKLREHVTPDWVKSGEPEDDQETSSESELDRFECVVCHKNFKSQKQFEAHERSKKHIKAVKQLSREMKAQDKQLDLDAVENQSNAGEFVECAEDLGQDGVSHPTTAFQLGNEADDESNPKAQNSSSDPTPLANPEVKTTAGAFADVGMNAVFNNDASMHTRRPANRTPSFHDDDDYASRETVESRLGSEFFSAQGVTGDSIHSSFEPLSIPEQDEAPSSAARNLGKAKQKRAKKAAQCPPDNPPELTCSTCNESFSSRTQLFSHVKDFDHARPVLKTSAAKKGKPKSNR